jgi:hypothetical protein
LLIKIKTNECEILKRRQIKNSLQKAFKIQVSGLIHKNENKIKKSNENKI